MEISNVNAGSLSIEVFATKNPAGVLTDLMLAVPCRCGLKEADSLRIDGLVMLAMRGVTVLPIDLPVLSATSRSDFLAWSRSGKKIAVGEFMAGGMLNNYFLNLVFVGI